MTKKIDLKKELKTLYGTTARQGFVFVEVPQTRLLMVDGEGDPNTSQAFSDAVEALYSLSYPLKFMVKKGPLATDDVVMPLERTKAQRSKHCTNFIEENGFERRGNHHEIYLSDMRRTDPAKRKTIIRQPVAPPSEANRSGAFAGPPR